MQLLKRKTRIPLPEVYSFDASLDNEIKCPSILMEYSDGKSMKDIWFDQSVPMEVLDERRIRSLQDVASAMVQLNRFQFDWAGRIEFDADGQLSQSIIAMRFQMNTVCFNGRTTRMNRRSSSWHFEQRQEDVIRMEGPHGRIPSMGYRPRSHGRQPRRSQECNAEGRIREIAG